MSRLPVVSEVLHIWSVSNSLQDLYHSYSKLPLFVHDSGVVFTLYYNFSSYRISRGEE